MWWHTVTHGRGSEWSVKPVLFTLPRNIVYPALLPLMRTPRLASSPLNWSPPAVLNGLVRFAEIRNLFSARVPSHFKRSLPPIAFPLQQWVLSRCVVQVFYERFWNGSNCPYYYWHQFSFTFHLPSISIALFYNLFSFFLELFAFSLNSNIT